MKRRKVSTVMDESLFRRVKLAAARQDRQISEVLAEAVEQYLSDKSEGSSKKGIVESSWGALSLDRRDVVRIMADEDGFLGA
ncbi:MAG: hypothetical protein HY720_20015 [Planctomycetes bacterium]|nr:hypothetical protein [Planctomycetota bacterium]